MIKKTIPRKLRLLAVERQKMRTEIGESALDELKEVREGFHMELDELMRKQADRLVVPELKRDMLEAGISEREAENHSRELANIMSMRVTDWMTVGIARRNGFSSKRFEKIMGMREDTLNGIEQVETNIIRFTAARAAQTDPRKKEMLADRIKHLEQTKELMQKTMNDVEFMLAGKSEAIKRSVRKRLAR